APDSAVWSYDLGASGWGNNELQNYTNDPSNVRVENGNLIITARRQGNNFTSARVKTENKLTFKYATVEARIKTPDLADGLWPAFWTLGNDISTVGWPRCGEIDVLEMGSASAISANRVNRRVRSTAHWESGGEFANYGRSIDRPSDIDGTFHVYRMEWTPTAITTYIDNVFIWSMDISNPSSFDGEEFHKPHFFLLNMAVGGNYTGILNSGGITAPFPAEYVIDYVRIFDNGHTVLGGSSLSNPGGGDNLLANPGFEEGTSGWTVNSGGGTIATAGAPARTGTSSLEIDNGGAGGWSSPNVVQSFPASPGETFNFNGYLRTTSPITDGSLALLKIVFRDSGGNDLLPASADVGTINTSFPGVESNTLDGSSPANQWVFAEAQGEAPAGTASVLFFVLNVNPPGSSTSIFVDDLEAGPPAATPVIAPPLTATRAGDDIELSFPTQNGVVYELAYKDSLTDASWTVVDTITGNGSPAVRTYPPTNGGRFYVVLIP
ncbi:MAG: glycoside hydrolase family 16 protein, partial [Akkermansiaceae bacterium]|nr:glycoside hydrolase family 16 protein [Akkermansiaceae bacterium]